MPDPSTNPMSLRNILADDSAPTPRLPERTLRPAVTSGRGQHLLPKTSAANPRSGHEYVEHRSIDLFITEIVNLLGNTELAKGWANSILEPLHKAQGLWTADVRSRVEIGLLSRLKEAVKHLEVGKQVGKDLGSKEFFFSGHVPPFECFFPNDSLPAQAMPELSWSREQVAEYNLSKLNDKKGSTRRIRQLEQGAFLDRVYARVRRLGFMRIEPVSRCWRHYIDLDKSDSPFNTATDELRSLFQGEESQPSNIHYKQILDFIEIVGETLEVVLWAKFVPPEQWHLWIPTRHWLIQKSGLGLSPTPQAPPKITLPKISKVFRPFQYNPRTGEYQDFPSETGNSPTFNPTAQNDYQVQIKQYDPTDGKFRSLSRRTVPGSLRKRAIYHL